MSVSDTSILLRRAKDGSCDAIDDLLRQVGDRLLAFIRLRTGVAGDGSKLDPEDLLQVTLLRAFERFDQFEGSEARTLMGWMSAIAMNEIRRAAEFHSRDKRDLNRQVPLEDIDVPNEARAHVRSEVTRIGLERDTETLERALEASKPEHREVILLRKLEELSFAEVGERMQRSPDACRKLLVRAMTSLSERMLEAARDA